MDEIENVGDSSFAYANRSNQAARDDGNFELRVSTFDPKCRNEASTPRSEDNNFFDHMLNKQRLP